MARLASARKSRLDIEDVDVDLKPIMGLVCILIPLVVYAFSFFEIKMQPVAAPKIAAPESGQAGEQEKKPLNLTVLVGADEGFVIKMEREVAGSQSDIKIPKKTFKGPDGRPRLDYDYPELYANLLQIKKRFRSETTINVGGDPNVPWGVIAKVIDAARVELKKERFTSLEEYSTAPEAVDEQGRPKLMFPQVVFVITE